MPTDPRPTSDAGGWSDAGAPTQLDPAAPAPAFTMIGDAGEVCVDGVCAIPAPTPAEAQRTAAQVDTEPQR